MSILEDVSEQHPEQWKQSSD